MLFFIITVLRMNFKVKTKEVGAVKVLWHCLNELHSVISVNNQSYALEALF